MLVKISDRPIRGSAALVALVVCLSLGACDDPLSVDDPDIAEPSDLVGPEGLQARRLGAFGDFAVAYGGSANEPGFILYSGLFADEFILTGPFAERSQIDARQITNSNRFLPSLYRIMHRARRAAESASEVWEQAEGVAETRTTVAEMRNLAGYSYVFFAEGFCSGVPFSRTTEDGEFEYGTGSTTTEMFDTAIAHFDVAISQAEGAGAADLAYLARVGKARALVDLGEFQPAADVVSEVPTDWEYTIKHSTNSNRQANGVVEFTNLNERWSVANNEGGGIGFRDAFEEGDPRTPWVVAPDSAASVPDFVGYHQLKYPERNSPIPVASGVEARLIEAEAALQAGAVGVFEQIHNELRASLNAPTVGPIDADAMSEDERVDFHFRERALWLWLTAHRHGDLRRLVRQYGRSADAVFPTGPYFKAEFGAYGTAVVFPVPVEERNNPNFAGQSDICLDHDA